MDTMAINAAIDAVMGGNAYGRVAQRILANNGDISVMRPWIGQDGRCYVTVNQGGKLVPKLVGNATLRKDEWKQYDTAVVKAAQQRLTGVADLRSRGLEYRTPGLAKTVLEYEDASDMEAAQLSMDGATRGKNDRVEYNLRYLPLPIIHKDFEINARALAASRNGGSPIDTTNAEMAALKVAELAELILFTGYSSFAFGGGTIYGYLDHSGRITGSLKVAWDNSAATGATIVGDVLNMKQAAINQRKYGPFVLYVPTAYEHVLDDNYVANYPTTIRQRILQIAGIEDVKVSDKMTAAHVLLVEMQATTARMVVGLDITTIEWEMEGGMLLKYKVMAIMVPQIRTDTYTSKTGVVDFS